MRPRGSAAANGFGEVNVFSPGRRKGNIVSGFFSFAGENEAGTEERSGRKLERTGVELNRNEAFGYAF